MITREVRQWLNKVERRQYSYDDTMYEVRVNSEAESHVVEIVVYNTPDEKVEVTAKLHWFCYRWVILWCILAIPSCGITLIFAFIAWLKISTVVMVCTNKRCVCREGILRVDATHPNALGYQIMADEIYDYLSSHNLI